MDHEHFRRRFGADARTWLSVKLMGKACQIWLRDGCKIGIARHEATDALVGVFDRTFLPGGTGVAEPAAGADTIFQSPESRKLGAAVKGEALACQGWQERECLDNLVHNRPRVPAWILDHHGVAALALDQ